MEKFQEIKFGLRKKGETKLLGYETQSNEGHDFSVGTQYILSTSEDNEWLVDSFEQAKYVKHNPSEWYNADYSNPTHCFSSESLEIVQVKIKKTYQSMEELPNKKVKLKPGNYQDGYYTIFTNKEKDFAYVPVELLKNKEIIVEDCSFNPNLFRLLEVKSLSIRGQQFAPKKDFI